MLASWRLLYTQNVVRSPCLAIGRRLRCSCLALLLASPICHSGTGPGPSTLLGSLVDADHVGGHQGYSVAVDGNIAVVGAPYETAGALESGVVRVYDAFAGRLLQTLTNRSPEDFEYFGVAVAISGTRVVIGASQDNTGAPA